MGGLNCTASVSLPGESETGFDDTRQVREMNDRKIRSLAISWVVVLISCRCIRPDLADEISRHIHTRASESHRLRYHILIVAMSNDRLSGGIPNLITLSRH